MFEEEEGLRADARANRDRILEVARTAFAVSPDASLNSIAKAAGVGPGTLYRHFPSREALVLALYRKEIEELVDLAPRLIAENPPLVAFRIWCDRLADYARIKHGIAKVIHTQTYRDLNQINLPIVCAIEHLLQACQRSGDFRTDVDSGDVLMLLSFIWHISPGVAGSSRASKLLDITMEGLKNCRTQHESRE
jgi:AcrR family transcriptional regulator